MAEQSEISTSTSSRPRRSRGGGYRLIVFLMIVVVLGAVIIWLLSERNARRFYLEPEGDKLVVKKGILFLTGSERYDKNKDIEPQEALLYSPIDLPDDYRNSGTQEFEDQASLNQELARILILQARELVFDPDEAKYQKGKSYLGRLTQLKGLDAKQLKVIQGLEADIDYLEAKRSYLGVEKILENALKRFRQAETFGTGRFADAGVWIRKVEALLESIRETKATSAAPAPDVLGAPPASLESLPDALDATPAPPPAGESPSVPRGTTASPPRTPGGI
ncbi:MAG: hypothetical protein JXR96_07905 [Deltaproteobacteria bacterium]|nr:hypothetical protein [Deltaproteobacteria bacterium]